MAPIIKNTMRVIVAVAVLFLVSRQTGLAMDAQDGPWQTALGAHRIFSFQPDYIPYRQAFLAYAVPGNASRLIVTPIGHTTSGDNPFKWRPKNRPLGAYVYLLDLKSSQLDLLAWNKFSAFRYHREVFRSQSASKYPALRTAGKLSKNARVLPIKKAGREWLAVISYKSKRSVKRSFGMPSPIPFMGRQKFIEKEESYKGTIYLEVFDMTDPAEPRVQLWKNFKNWPFLPMDSKFFIDWAINTDRPYLLLMDIKLNAAGNAMQGRIIIISPTATGKTEVQALRTKGKGIEE
jgi:hypothetical protein